MKKNSGEADASGAFAFLIVQTVRNRAASQLGRIKNPRYAIAALFGLGYFWLVFFRPGSGSSANRGPKAITDAMSTVMMALVGFGTLVSLIYAWLKSGGASALAFQPAEVQFLFTAPVSRRALLIYKMVRSQIVLLVNAVFWTFLLRNWGVTISTPERFLTAWGFFTVLSVHRLALALMQLPPVHGARRIGLWVAKLIAGGALAAIVIGTVPVAHTFATTNIDGGFAALKDALGTGALAYALWPIRQIMAPLVAPTDAAWLSAFAVVLGVLALHVAWVLSLDVPFEEAATAASAEVAKRIAAFKERRAGGTAPINVKTAKRDWLPLSPVGYPAVAITWKNTVALIRAGSLRSAVMLVILLAIITRAMSWGSKGTMDAALALPYVILFFFTLIMGPRALRNDLRQDLLNLPLLKSYPLSGAQLVFAELVSPTLVLTLFEVLMLVVAYFVAPQSVRDKVALAPTVAAFVLVPLALLAINTISIGIQNGAAVLLPSWVRLGADSGGFEAMGQNLMLTFGSVLALLVALILPVGITAATVAFVAATNVAAIIVAGVAAITVLACEIWWMVSALGRAFERMDPSALT